MSNCLPAFGGYRFKSIQEITNSKELMQAMELAYKNYKNTDYFEADKEGTIEDYTNFMSYIGLENIRIEDNFQYFKEISEQEETGVAEQTSKTARSNIKKNTINNGITVIETSEGNTEFGMSIDTSLMTELQDLNLTGQEVAELSALGFLPLIDTLDDTLGTRHEFTREQAKQFNSITSNAITGFTIQQQEALLESVQHVITQRMAKSENLDNFDIAKELESAYKEVLDNLQKKSRDRSAKLAKSSNERIKDILKREAKFRQQIGIARKQADKIIGNTEEHKGDLVIHMEALFNKSIDTIEEAENVELLDETDNTDKQRLDDVVIFNQSADQRDAKREIKTELKAIFMNFTKTKFDKDGNIIPVLNALGLPQLEDPNFVLNKVQQLLMNKTNNWADIIASIDAKAKQLNNPLFKAIKETLENLPEQLKNQLLYKLAQQEVNHTGVFIKTERTKDINKPSTTSVTTLKENSRKSLANKYKQISLDIFNNANGKSNIVLHAIEKDSEGNEISVKRYNLERINNLISRINRLSEDFFKLKIINKTAVIGVLRDLGINNISDEVITEYINQENLFPKKSGLLGLVNETLKDLAYDLEEKGMSGVPVNENNIRVFNRASSALNKLLVLSDEIEGTDIISSFKIAGKTYGSVANSIEVQDKVDSLKKDTTQYEQLDELRAYSEQVDTELAKLLDTQIGKNNTLVQLLRDNPDARKLLELSWISPDFIKMDENADDNIEVHRLDPIAFYTGLFNVFSDYKGQSEVDYREFDSLKFRTALLPSLVFSDKNRMQVIKTINFEVNTNEGFEYKQQGDKILLENIPEGVVDYLYQNLFVGEFERIKENYKQGNFNIVNYNETGKLFNAFPAFNEIKVTKINEQGEAIDYYLHDFLKGNLQAEDINAAMFEAEAKRMLKEFAIQTTNQRLIDLTNTGLFSRAFSGYNDLNFSGLNSEFINSREGETSKHKFLTALLEYEMNFIVNQNNQYVMFLGDQAFYGKDKLAKKTLDTFLEDPENNKGIFNKYAQATAFNIDKRSAKLIAPGSKLANSERSDIGIDGNESKDFIQINVNDSVIVSEYIVDIIRNNTSNLSKETEELLNLYEYKSREIAKLQDERIRAIENENLTEEEREAALYQIDNELSLHQTGLDLNGNQVVDDSGKPLYGSNHSMDTLTKAIQEIEPKLKDYFEITATDAQEYATWQTHLDMLYRKGELSPEQKEIVKSYFEQFSSGNFNIKEEHYNLVMQPIKGVYTYSIRHAENGAILDRPIYIKSSIIPLLPHITKNTKLDAVRQHMEDMQNATGKNVKMSYQTANKIGATNTSLTMEQMYNSKFEDLYASQEELESGENTSKILNDSSIVLPYKGFRIQQETPAKQEKYFKKGQDPHISMGSQFFKIILDGGLGTNEYSFSTSAFDSKLLNRFGIQDGVKEISGERLQKLYNDIYKEYSDTLKEQLLHELGIDNSFFTSPQTVEKQKEFYNKLVDLIKEEINNSSSPQYLKDSLGIVEEVIEGGATHISTKIPLSLDNNTFKFEQILQAIVSNRLISHELPGNGHIAASAEGFKRKITLDELSPDQKEGIVWLGDMNRDLNPTYITKENGEKKLVKARILIESHFSYNKVNEDGTRTWTKVDLSSDQYSEPIVENSKVVGRKLKMEMFDEQLLSMFSYRIPTSSHQSGAIVEVAGFLPSKFGNGDTVVVPAEHTTQFGEDFDIDKRYIYKHNYYVDKEGKVKKTEYYTSDKKVKRKDAYKKKIKGLENALIDMYHTVYNSTDERVQAKIAKPLVTAVADETASLIQSVLDKGIEGSYFTNLSHNFQQYLLKLGADGKDAIGIHSNAVVIQAQLNKVPKGHKIRLGGHTYTFGLVSSRGVLGNSFRDITDRHDIGDQHGENQNVGTDNINKQIMIKRNENSYTMPVFAMMAFHGIYTNGVYTYENGKKVLSNGIVVGEKEDGSPDIRYDLSIPSLFMSQPILRRYVELMVEGENMFKTGNKFSDTKVQAIKKLFAEFRIKVTRGDKEVKGKDLNRDIIRKFLEDKKWNNGVQDLFDNLDKGVKASGQLEILADFLRLESEAKTMVNNFKLINLSSSKLGVSTFSNATKIDRLNKIAESVLNKAKKDDPILYSEASDAFFNIPIINFDQTIGTPITPSTYHNLSAEEKAQYTKIGDYFWKPTTTEGTMLINSLSVANGINQSLFNYSDTALYRESIVPIIRALGEQPNKDTQRVNKMKYSIMDDFRDFIFTHNMSKIFNNVEEERDRLLFDELGVNRSLAGILQDLNISQSDFMRNNIMLKNFTFKVKNDGTPSIVENIDFEKNIFNQNAKIVAFKKLLQDNKTNLGIFNGEILTPRKLALDLFSYAYLMTSSNTVSNIRKLIPIELLDTLGIDVGLRELDREFMHNTSSNVNTEIYQNFVNQYLQTHWEDIPRDNRSKINLFGNIPETAEFNRAFVRTQEDPNTGEVLSRKIYKEYVYYDNGGNIHTVHEELSPIENIKGFHQYDASKSTITNKVVSKANRGTEISRQKKSGKDLNANSFLSSPRFKGLHTVQGIIDSLTTEGVKQNDPHLYEIFSNINGAGLKTKIEIKPIEGKARLAEYNFKTDTITIVPHIWEALQRVKEVKEGKITPELALKEIVAEEVLHAATVNNIRQYITTSRNGDVTVSEDAPDHVKTIVALYEQAREEVPYDKNDGSTYGSSNIYEFIANIFTNESYRDRFKGKKVNIVTKFFKAIKEFLLGLGQNNEFLKVADKVINNLVTYSNETQAKASKEFNSELEIEKTLKGLDVNKRIEVSSYKVQGLSEISVLQYMDMIKELEDYYNTSPEDVLDSLLKKGLIEKNCY